MAATCNFSARTIKDGKALEAESGDAADADTILSDVEVVLLDIEGTVCPISFVKDVLFPYARTALSTVLATEWNSPRFIPYRDAFPAEHRTDQEAFLFHYQDLATRDLKITYIKSLQGYLWTRGYESGALRCTLFPDVVPALEQWHRAGLIIMIYSSGSVAAQQLLFQYTDEKPEEDLRGLISGWFDTVNAGGKMEVGSYEKILKTRVVGARKWLFLSDNVREVEAAKRAGMKSFVVVREGNAELSDEEKKDRMLVHSFSEINLRKSS